jgi:hypothetical protein
MCGVKPEQPVGGALAFLTRDTSSRIARAVQRLLTEPQAGASLRHPLNRNTMENS